MNRPYLNNASLNTPSPNKPGLTKPALFEDFAQYFSFVYANTDELKRQSYLIRYQVYGNDASLLSARSSKMDIDQYDAHSHHILVRHKSSGRYAGCVRVVESPKNNSKKLLPMEEVCKAGIWADRTLIGELPRGSYSEISRLAIIPGFARREGESEHASSVNDAMRIHRQTQDGYRQFPKLELGLYLASFSLARLLFHDYVFVTLTAQSFKKLRAFGLMLEQASGVFGEVEPKAVYALNLESGINSANLVYELHQHILNEIAHQLNIPLVQDNESDASQSA